MSQAQFWTLGIWMVVLAAILRHEFHARFGKIEERLEAIWRQGEQIRSVAERTLHKGDAVTVSNPN